MISYALLLGFCVFRPVVLQLIYKDKEDIARMNQCPFEEVILPAHVTNLQRHEWKQMLVTWKYGGLTMYSFNGEHGEHKNNGTHFGLQNLKNEDIQSGDVSLHFLEIPPNGIYTCETTELSTEGSKTVEMAYKELDPLIKSKIGIITIPVLLVVANISEIIFLVKYLHKTSGRFISGYCIQIIGIILLAVGLCLFQNGNLWNPLQKAGLVVAVCPPLLIFLISDVLFGYKIEDTRFRFGCLCCCGLQVLFFLIATAGAIMCMQDCPPNLISEMLLISGLLLYTITEIGDISCCCYCYWLEHKEDRSNQMVNATPNSNNEMSGK